MDTINSLVPPFRFGHQAVHDETGLWSGDTLKRMLVFGGKSSPHPDSLATDARLWRFTLDPTNHNRGTWDIDTTTHIDTLRRRPLPRFGHAMVRDSSLRKHPTLDSLGRVCFMYGGKLSTGAYSDTLWALWTFRDGTIRWQVVRDTLSGSEHPGPRADHALAYDREQGVIPATGQTGGRLYLFGGRSSDTALADSGVFVLDPWAAFPVRSWDRWEGPPLTSFTGHTMTLERAGVSARVAEVFNAADVGNEWQAHDQATLADRNYPITFSVPSPYADTLRAVTVPASLKPYYLSIPLAAEAGPWRPSAAQALSYIPLNGVLYQPDRMMIGGGRADTVVNNTHTFDVSNPAGSGWVEVGAREHKRYHHNLVILPNGDVMAVGGTAGPSEDAVQTPVLKPEIWNDSTGTWFDSIDGEDLASQAMVRDYHSTAILLPDGRVLSAGGQNKLPDRNTAELYCPPYLFSSDGVPATRPPVTGSPLTLGFRDTVTVCVSDTSYIRRAVLMRPGATTHSFDQNQRRVPLSLTKDGNPGRVFITTPPEWGTAPLGDYMLFLLGSEDGWDVPSIARWVRVATTAGLDLCDFVKPATLAPSPELIGLTSIYFEWTAPADDASLAASGRAVLYDMRRSTSPIQTPTGWNAATQLGDEPVPWNVGSLQSMSALSLQSCTNYYFALRAKDDNDSLSAIHDTVKVKTLCTGGGGGGPGGDGRDVVSTGSNRREQSFGTLPQQATGAAAALVIESEPAEGGAWRVILRSLSQFEGADANLVQFQAKDAGGAWQTKGTIEPAAADALLGVCAPKAAGRRVFPGSYELQEIARSLRSASGPLALASAEHSSAGSITTAVQGGNGAVSLTPGQTLELVYEPSELATPPTDDWFALLQRNDEASPTRDGVAEGLDLPKQFALYQNQPNPFSQVTTIRFDLPKPVPVRLTIYDIAGRRVRLLLKEDWPAGRHAVEWDHRSDAGVQLGAGAYIYRIQAGEFRAERKMIVLP